jgi:hypothetical protein
MVISFIATWFKRLGANCLAFVILWHLTSHDAPRRGKAMVHLASPDHAVVSIDHDLYRVNSAADTPVVCELAPGRHVAQVWRNGFLVGEQAFTIEPGRVAIIGPLDPATAKARTPAPAGKDTKALDAILADDWTVSAPPAMSRPGISKRRI